MDYLTCDEFFYKDINKAQVEIFGVQDNREVVVQLEDTKTGWKKRGKEKYDEILKEVISNPKVHFEELSPYTQHLVSVCIEENTPAIRVPEFEIEQIASGNGKTLDEAVEEIRKDVDLAAKKGINLYIGYENEKFIPPNVSDVDFPLGFAEEIGYACRKDYANVGVLYQRRSDEDLADEIADALMDNVPKTDMNYHIASVIADESVDRMRMDDDVERAVKGTVEDMTYGCNSGSITEMIYTKDILKFFNTYEEDIRSVINSLYKITDVPDMNDWAVNGNDTKEWMAKNAYEATVSMFDGNMEWCKYKLRDIELYEEKEEKVKNIDRKDVKDIIIEQSRGKSVERK